MSGNLQRQVVCTQRLADKAAFGGNDAFKVFEVGIGENAAGMEMQMPVISSSGVAYAGGQSSKVPRRR